MTGELNPTTSLHLLRLFVCIESGKLLHSSSSSLPPDSCLAGYLALWDYKCRCGWVPFGQKEKEKRKRKREEKLDKGKKDHEEGRENEEGESEEEEIWVDMLDRRQQTRAILSIPVKNFIIDTKRPSWNERKRKKTTKKKKEKIFPEEGGFYLCGPVDEEACSEQIAIAVANSQASQEKKGKEEGVGSVGCIGDEDEDKDEDKNVDKDAQEKEEKEKREQFVLKESPPVPPDCLREENGIILWRYEKTDAWINCFDFIFFCHNSRSLIIGSELGINGNLSFCSKQSSSSSSGSGSGSGSGSSPGSGFSHLYQISFPSSSQYEPMVQAITSGEWVVTKIIRVNEQKNLIFFTGTRDSSLETHLYVTSLHSVTPPKDPVRLTRSDLTHKNAYVDQECTFFMVNSSNILTPSFTSISLLCWDREKREKREEEQREKGGMREVEVGEDVLRIVEEYAIILLPGEKNPSIPSLSWTRLDFFEEGGREGGEKKEKGEKTWFIQNTHHTLADALGESERERESKRREEREERRKSGEVMSGRVVEVGWEQGFVPYGHEVALTFPVRPPSFFSVKCPHSGLFFVCFLIFFSSYFYFFFHLSSFFFHLSSFFFPLFMKIEETLFGWYFAPDGPGPHPTILYLYGGPSVPFSFPLLFFSLLFLFFFLKNNFLFLYLFSFFFSLSLS